MSLASIAVTTIGVLAALLLIGTSRESATMDAFDAVSIFLRSLITFYSSRPSDLQATFLLKNKHTTLGFQPLALLYSVPKSLLSWSAGLVALQALIALVRVTNADVYAVLACAGALIVMAGFLRMGWLWRRHEIAAEMV